MLNFLIEDCGIEEAVIKDLKNTYSEGNIYALDCNEFEVIKIIKYFREIGIEYIDELLVNNIEIFFCKFSEISEKINESNVEEVVKIVNEDYMLINDIVFGTDE